MTIDQNIFDLTLLALAFFLTTVLLFILYSRSLDQLKASLQENISQYKAYEDLHKNYQVSLEKCKHLALDYAKSEAKGNSLISILELEEEQRKQLRKDFIEQSEIATAWRQKHDRLAVQAELLHNDFVKMTELLKEANDAAISCEPVKGIDHQLRSSEGEEILTHNDIMKHYVDLRMKVKNDKTYSFHEGELDFSAESLKGEESHVDSTKSEEILMIPEEDKTIDWSKPQPFPVSYEVPKGIIVVAVVSDGQIKKGRVGRTVERSTAPIVEWEGVDFISKLSFCSFELAPINPTDHPLHPEFKDPDKQDPDPNSPNEIARNWDKLTPYPKGCIVPINEPSINVSSDNKLIKIGELGYLCQSKANYTKVWFYPIDSKLVQERTRRDYIECEVHNFAPTNPHHHPDHPFYGISKEQLILTPDGWKLKEDEKFISVNLSPYQNTFNIPNPDHF